MSLPRPVIPAGLSSASSDQAQRTGDHRPTADIQRLIYRLVHQPGGVSVAEL